MEYADIFVPAEDVCRFHASYRDAVKHFRKHGIGSKVNLAMAQMPCTLEAVWYTFDEDAGLLKITPAFKNFCKADFEPPIEPSSIMTLKGGKMFCRNSRLYYFDAISINKVKCLCSQEIIKAYAAFQGMSDDCEFRLVKAYTIGKRREFVAVEWVVMDKKLELYYPVFSDDLEKFRNPNGDYLGPLEFDYEPLYVGDSFVHENKLWEAAWAPDHTLCIRHKAPHLTISFGGQNC